MPTYHKLDKIVMPSGVEFSDLRNVRVTPDIRELLEHPAGHPFPMFTANQETKPAIAFTTRQIDVVLGAIGSGGAAVTADSYLYFKLATATGIPNRATLTHRRYRVPQCLAYWTACRAPHNAPGDIDVVLMASFDGTNDPIIPQTAVALAGNQTAGTFFGAGPCFINGVQIAAGSIQNIDVQSGIRLLQIGGDTEEFDRFVGVEVGQPTVSITSHEAVALFTYGLRGTALNGVTGVLAYLRKFANTGSRVANATAQHLAFQGLSGVARPQESGGDGTGVTSDQVRCNLIAGSDSVLPLLQLTAQTIP